MKVIIDVSQRQRLIKSIHEGPGSSIESASTGAHLGRDKTTQKIGERFFWPNYSRDVREYCLTCHDCQMSNTRFIKNVPELQPVSVPVESWKQIGVDLCSMPKTDDGYVCFALAVDYQSKWVVADGLKAKTAAEVARFLYNIQCQYGAVNIQINDQGPEFVNKVSEEIHTLTGVHQRITSAYHPQANGLAERNNRTIQSCLLKTLQQRQTEWMRALPGVVFAYNTSRQKSTKFTPFYLMFGRQARLFIEMEDESTDVFDEEIDSTCILPEDDIDHDQFQINMESNKRFVYQYSPNIANIFLFF